jgi:hypothetical protein
MSQTAITLAFEQWKAQQGADNKPVVLDEFVLANVPGLDTSKPIDRNETLPPASQIVHRQAVSLTGVVNENAVVYSVTLGSDVGDFSFNWIGLVNKATGTLAMVIHAPLQTKYKNASGQQGNVLTRSFLMEYNGAATETQITTPAETWQIDFTARLAGMDERQRMDNVEVYGQGAFFADGFLVAKTGAQYFVTKGVGYIGGVRASLAANANITVTTKPMKVWADVSYHGTLTSAFQIDIKITLATTLANYTQGGIAHYVFALASIDANGVITDLRPKGSLGEQQGNSDYLRKDKNLADLKDAATARKSLGLKGSAVLDVGTTASTVAAGDDSRIVNATPNTRKVNGHALTADVNVTAQDIFNGQAIAIPNAADLNDYTTPGLYYQNANVQAASGKNYPESNAGTLEIYKNAGTTQVYRTYGSSRTYSRSLYGGAWTRWGKVYDTENKPTAAEVGTVPLTGGDFTGTVGFRDNNESIIIYPKTADAAYYLRGRKFDNSNHWYIGQGGSGSDDVVWGNNKTNSSIALRSGEVLITGTLRTTDYTNFDARYLLCDSANYAGFANNTITSPYMRHRASNTVVYLARTDYAYSKTESNTRFVTAVRFGASAIFSERSNTERMAGGVMTSWQDSGSSNYSFRLRPLQYLLNGTWVTAAYA